MGIWLLSFHFPLLVPDLCAKMAKLYKLDKLFFSLINFHLASCYSSFPDFQKQNPPPSFSFTSFSPCVLLTLLLQQ